MLEKLTVLGRQPKGDAELGRLTEVVFVVVVVVFGCDHKAQKFEFWSVYLTVNSDHSRYQFQQFEFQIRLKFDPLFYQKNEAVDGYCLYDVKNKKN